jgi:nucleotide-binding universal stress UspA family protein
MNIRAGFVFLVLGAACDSASGQDVAARVAKMPNGEVRFATASRPDVCGDGAQLVSVRGRLFLENYNSNSLTRWEEKCVQGPLRVRMTLHDGSIDRLQMSVAGQWDDRTDGVLDLGTLPAATAASYLLSLGETAGGKAASRAVTAAVLIDSVTIWPSLLRIARRTDRPKSARSEALFWLSVLAGDKSAGNTDDLDADGADEKSNALFVLHELRHGEGTPELLRIAKENKDPQVRRRALFWLGQDADPRAIDLFEQILRQK